MAELRQHEPANGGDLFLPKVVLQFRFEIGKRHATLHGVVPVGVAEQRLDLVDIVLVLDLANDLLENVLQRHQARGAAKLINHDRQVTAAALKVPQLPVEPLRLGHKAGWANQVLPWLVRGCTVVQPRQHVLGVQHADDRVGMSVQHDQAGVFAPPQRGDHLGFGLGHVNGDDIDTGRHHLRHGHRGQGEHAQCHVVRGRGTVAPRR